MNIITIEHMLEDIRSASDISEALQIMRSDYKLDPERENADQVYELESALEASERRIEGLEASNEDLEDRIVELQDNIKTLSDAIEDLAEAVLRFGHGLITSEEMAKTFERVTGGAWKKPIQK